MESLRLSPAWMALLGASILCDVVATAYLKWAGDRFSATFLLANGASIASATDSGTTYCLNQGTAGGCGFAKAGDFTCPAGNACQGGTLCTGRCMY